MDRRKFIRGSGIVVSSILSGCSETSNDAPEDDSSTDSYQDVDNEEPGENTHSEPDNVADAEPPGEPALNPSDSWPMINFDAQHTGYNPDGNGIREPGDSWRLARLNPPTVTSEGLYTTGADNERYIEYRDPTTAELRHRERFTETGIFNPPTLIDERVLVSAMDGFYCFDTDGELRWKDLEHEVQQGGSPVGYDDRVFITRGGQEKAPSLLCYDIGSGEREWKYELPAAPGRSCSPAVYDEMVYVTTEAGLTAVETDSGEQEFNREGDAATRNPVVTNESVYYFEGDDLVAVEASDGGEHWRSGVDPNRSRGPVGTPLVASSDLLYIGSGQDGLVALDQENGSVAIDYGEQGIDRGERVTPEARVGNVLYVTEGGTLHAFAADNTEHLWTYETEELSGGGTVDHIIFHVAPVSNVVYLDAVDGFHGIEAA